MNTAEANVVRLEEENKLKEGYADRVKQMTRSLDQLQKASEKREAMEKKLRAKLEEELRELREDARNGFASVDANQRPTEDLRSKLSEAEEKVKNTLFKNTLFLSKKSIQKFNFIQNLPIRYLNFTGYSCDTGVVGTHAI